MEHQLDSKIARLAWIDYRVWKIGHGEYMPERIAKSWVIYSNEKYSPHIFHYLEYPINQNNVDN
jgi:hypothetical protein